MKNSGMNSGMKKLALTVVSIVVLSGFTPEAFGQDGTSFGLFATPEVQLPVGEKAENYKTGIGGRFEGLLGFSGESPVPPFITPSLDLAYSFVPLDLGEDGFASSANLTLLRGGLGAKAVYEAGDRFSFFARMHASGYYAGLGGDTSGTASGFSWGGGGGLSPRREGSAAPTGLPPGRSAGGFPPILRLLTVSP